MWRVRAGAEMERAETRGQELKRTSSNALPSPEPSSTLMARDTEEEALRESLTVRVRVTRPVVAGAVHEVLA